MEENKINYAEAVAEIESILAKMNSSTLDVDSLAGYVDRATKLMAQCRERLLHAQGQVEQILNPINLQ